MALHQNSGGLSSAAVYPVSTFVSYSVYAASGSTVTAKVAGSNVATYTIPASGVLTVSDLCDQVSVNASFTVVGLVSTSLK